MKCKRLVLNSVLYPPLKAEKVVYYEPGANPVRLRAIQQLYYAIYGEELQVTTTLEPDDYVFRPWYVREHFTLGESLTPPVDLPQARTFTEFYHAFSKVPLVVEPRSWAEERFFTEFKTRARALKNYEKGRRLGLGTHTSFLFSVNALNIYSCISWARSAVSEGECSEELLKQLCWRPYFHMKYVRYFSTDLSPSDYTINDHSALTTRWASGVLDANDLPIENIRTPMNALAVRARHGIMTNEHRLVASQVLLHHLKVPWWWGEKAWKQINIDYDEAVNVMSWRAQSVSRFLKQYSTAARLEKVWPIRAFDISDFTKLLV